jgi:putative Mn2+ efflux pump MntP
LSYFELFLLAVGLSADAFAVSVTNGMCMKNIKFGWTLLIGLTFGLFQGAMPVIGYALGSRFTEHIKAYDHYIALILLGFIGGKMLFEGIRKKGERCCNEKVLLMTFGTLMVQGVATSIDALAVGVSFAAMSVKIVSAAAFICCVTLALSIIAVKVGKKFGTLLNNKAEILGGFILISIGVKIFIEHTFFGG